MTSPRADSDLLMCCASRRRLPSAPDLPTRSEPARSTRFSFPVVRRPVLQSTPRTVTMSSAWERELCSLRLVNSVVRLL